MQYIKFIQNMYFIIYAFIINAFYDIYKLENKNEAISFLFNFIFVILTVSYSPIFKKYTCIYALWFTLAKIYTIVML